MVNIFDVICIGAALVDMIAQVARHPFDDDEVIIPEGSESGTTDDQEDEFPPIPEL